jgi:predicted RND superfamily exporter protein
MNVTKNLIENYKLFQKIQINKYLKTFNKTDFSDTIERFHVLQKIRNKFQTSVISEIDRFKTELEKKEFFKSINIDFYSEQIDEETENRLEITQRNSQHAFNNISFHL